MIDAFQTAMIIVLTIAVTAGLVAVIKLWVELKAMKNSTHQITYIDPLQQNFANKPTGKEAEAMNADPMGNIGIDMGGLE